MHTNGHNSLFLHRERAKNIMDENRIKQWDDEKQEYFSKLMNLAEETAETTSDDVAREALAKVLKYGTCLDAAWGIELFVGYNHAGHEIRDMKNTQN